MKNITLFLFLFLFLMGFCAFSQEKEKNLDEKNQYKKRVLETTEIDVLTSYYTQDGDNASVSGGKGTEKLNNGAGNIVVSIPLNTDDILTIDAGISAYTSASSSNLNPFDGTEKADPFVASSGASQADALVGLNASYSHSSDDRTSILGGNVAVAFEFDYSSIGFGGNYAKLFNEKNTELSVAFNIFLDNWKLLYPYELGGSGGEGAKPFNIADYNGRISGNQNYQPNFKPYTSTGRNTYNLNLGFSQILSEKAQASLSLDITQQNGQLANHMQRVCFKDVADTFIDNFHLADDVEQLPDSRFKTAIGGRFNYYINERFVVRTFYRYYFDNWDINSHTASIEIPFKLTDKWTLYPSYRFYSQAVSKYFAPYEEHLSTDEYYTSDYDLSKFNANQYGFGVSYTNPFSEFNIWKMNFKSFDLKYNNYQRNTGLVAHIITGGVKFTF